MDEYILRVRKIFQGNFSRLETCMMVLWRKERVTNPVANKLNPTHRGAIPGAAFALDAVRSFNATITILRSVLHRCPETCLRVNY